jgi:hypothetical protein
MVVVASEGGYLRNSLTPPPFTPKMADFKHTQFIQKQWRIKEMNSIV